MKVNTELCVDLRTELQNEVLMKPDKDYRGILRRDTPSEEIGFDNGHYTFVETLSSTSERNPRIFSGRFISVTRGNNGDLRPNFCRPKYTENFCFQDFCHGAVKELLVAASLLVE